MKKSVLTLSVAAVVGIGSLLAAAPSVHTAYASKLSELQSEQKEINSKKSGVNSKINNAEQDIKEIEKEQSTVKSDIHRLDLAISDAVTKITGKEKEIDKTKKDIKKLQEDIQELSKRIETRNELLKERARAYQQTGSKIGYLEVLFGAKSFGDFIDRLGAIATIMEADRGIIEEHKRDRKDLENKQKKVEKELTSLEKMLKELESLKSSLSTQKAEKDAIMADLKEQQGQLKELTVSLEEEQRILAAQETAIKKAIQMEQQRLEEERRKAQENANNGNGNNNGSTPPPVSSGNFTRPAEGYISSGFRTRERPDHHGVDIAKGGTVPIVAAADGYVIRSEYSNSYGNVVYITHSIDGQIYTTVYAHMRSRSVGNMQMVKKGQLIGYMGNTGYSFGQHLHFELHRGAWNSAKSNAINPVGIVPF